MAEVDTQLLSTQHSDIRREAAEHTNEIVKEALKGDFALQSAIKDARHDVSDVVGSNADRLDARIGQHHSSITDRFFDVGRDTSDLRAQVTQTISEVRAAADRTAKDAEIAVLKNTIESAKNTAMVIEKVGQDGYETRRLMNELKDRDLQRMLIERNAEVFDERAHGRHWRGNFDQAQYASIVNQMQNFGSQLQETRQGMVNFGTMAGVGQTSSSNNV